MASKVEKLERNKTGEMVGLTKENQKIWDSSQCGGEWWFRNIVKMTKDDIPLCLSIRLNLVENNLRPGVSQAKGVLM